FRHDGAPVEPEIVSAVLGRATNVASDQEPILVFDGNDFTAPVDLALGNWNLRLVAKSADGTEFKQRIIVDMHR
ncbi:MAG: FixH family protein, partial [Loktanella sp.]|nr:FixH family protein [Loktanella sp.]